MAILPILTYPEPKLRKHSKEITEITEELKILSQNMLETMYASKGIGLAAPQVGELIRLIVVDTLSPRTKEKSDKYEMSKLESEIPQPLILFNPTIIHKSGAISMEEGCLSVPSYFEFVDRAETIVFESLNENGKKIKIETDGLLSVCIQHEIDHLDGKLFIDRLSTIKANLIKSKIKKFGYPPKPDSKTKKTEPVQI